MIDWFKNRNSIALIYQNKKYTYKKLYEYINKTQIYLKNNAIKKGDRVILLGSNSIEFVILLFALNFMEAIFVILDNKLNDKRLKYIFNDISASMIIVDNNIYVKKSHIINKMFKQIIVTEEFLFNLNKEDENICELKTEKIKKHNVATIIYTSGSTGNPKGVISSNENIKFVVEKINQRLNYQGKDVVFNGLNFSFDYGLYQIFLTFYVGATLILEKNFENLLTIPFLLNKYKVTVFPIVPTIINTLLFSRLLDRVELPFLSKITSTGEVLQLSTINKLQKLLALLHLP